MSLATQAVVSDIIAEFNAQGTGPYTVFNVAGITSGQIYDKITEANMYLQSMVGVGGTSVGLTAFQTEQIKRFEVNYASARLGQDLIGIETTDGFNYNLGGLAVQRAGVQIQAYKEFIDTHLAVAKAYIDAFHQWFFPFNPNIAQGVTENGVPVTYWATSQPRYG